MVPVVVADEGALGVGAVALDLADEVPPLVRVRRWAGEALADLPDDDLTDCVLVVTELVSNAYDHGGPSRRVRLLRTLDPCRIRVEVYDSAHGRVRAGRSRLGAHRGRGLVIVENVADAWASSGTPRARRCGRRSPARRGPDRAPRKLSGSRTPDRPTPGRGRHVGSGDLRPHDLAVVVRLHAPARRRSAHRQHAAAPTGWSARLSTGSRPGPR